MKLPSLFRKDDAITANTAQDRAERLLAESFRLLGQLCGTLATAIRQRMAGEGCSRLRIFHSLREETNAEVQYAADQHALQ